MTLVFLSLLLNSQYTLLRTYHYTDIFKHVIRIIP